MSITSTPSIPFFRYPHVFQQQREEITAAMMKVMERGAFILQDELVQFEQDVARFVGSRHAIGVADGTESMIIALCAAGIGAGDEVIFCSHTYIATASAIHFAGATPVPVDMRADRCIDPEAVRKAITRRTKAIIPTQLNGRTCDMDAIMSIASEHGLIVIEDAAQALGSKFKGRCAGTFGFAGSISLYPAKVLGCFGDGGLLFTQDDAVNETLRELRDHGRNRDGHVVRWGLNSRLDTLQAAILLVKLRQFPAEIARRRELASIYHDRLRDLEQMTLPPGPTDNPDHFDIYQNYEVEGDRRDELRAHLQERGVRTIVQWAGTPVHRFAGLGFDGVRIPGVERFFERCFLLPMNTSLANDEVHYVCDCIRGFYGR
ncbi:MAG: DegT/DnrJ/EryC1/StrS family aminotransferase [Proteobacteria bacterium]|jgi:dTDP-4-amino-4,6-dideoxygalactose transaminase|nr:DegT/DnrJ/EryC1/StrS family aminotransferase [Pseudomonadota bacterium]